MSEQNRTVVRRVEMAPGVCVPWSEKREEFPKIMGDEAIVKRTWQEIDGLGYLFVWHCLVSF